MKLIDNFNRSSNHQIETTSINGESYDEVKLSPSWESDYQAYLIKYNAEHKDEINN